MIRTILLVEIVYKDTIKMFKNTHFDKINIFHVSFRIQNEMQNNTR